MKFKTRNKIGYAVATVFALVLLKVSTAGTQIRDEGVIAEAPIEDYVGSRACAECHQGQYEDWSEKHMSHFVRYRGDVSGALEGNWSNSPIDAEDVFIIIGGRRKLAFVDKSWKVFPYQYHFKKKKWQKRDKWASQDYRLRCGPCHTVGLVPSTRQFVEDNVGCEACHGPGRMHTNSPEQKKMKVPGKTDGHNVLFSCRRCHNDRRNHAREIDNFNGVFHSEGE